MVVGATNCPDSLDPALRRAGRFDKEVCLGIPDKNARAGILQIHTSKVKLSPEICLQVSYLMIINFFFFFKQLI